jgi:uncharacterized membrane protein
MRTILVIFGVIFLVIGGLLYFVPMQNFKADTTTTEGGNVDVRTSSARVTIPVEWAYASAIIGFVLLILGLIIPDSVKVVQGPRGPRGRVPARYRRSTPRRSRKRAALPKGTTVTTTTRIKR